MEYLRFIKPTDGFFYQTKLPFVDSGEETKKNKKYNVLSYTHMLFFYFLQTYSIGIYHKDITPGSTGIHAFLKKSIVK